MFTCDEYRTQATERTRRASRAALADGIVVTGDSGFKVRHVAVRLFCRPPGDQPIGEVVGERVAKRTCALCDSVAHAPCATTSDKTTSAYPPNRSIWRNLAHAIVTAAYWAFTLTDGALRLLVLLHFHDLGYTPVQLAFLFLLCEFFGIVTNLVGGWLAARTGLRVTLVLGLALSKPV
jgi:hypothetical protein